MTISVCIGTSCHIKGTPQIVFRLQQLIRENHLSDEISLTGSLCTGDCARGVCVRVDGVLHSLSPDKVDEFFEREIKGVFER